MALDGTKIHANASRHSALSYEHAGKLAAQLKAEVGVLPGLTHEIALVAEPARQRHSSVWQRLLLSAPMRTYSC